MKGNEIIRVLGHNSTLTGYIYWAGVNLGKWNEFCYELCSWPGSGSSIDRLVDQ